MRGIPKEPTGKRQLTKEQLLRVFKDGQRVEKVADDRFRVMQGGPDQPVSSSHLTELLRDGTIYMFSNMSGTYFRLNKPEAPDFSPNVKQR